VLKPSIREGKRENAMWGLSFKEQITWRKPVHSGEREQKEEGGKSFPTPSKELLEWFGCRKDYLNRERNEERWTDNTFAV